MKRLLHINASPRGGRSRSGAIAAGLLTALAEKTPALEIETLDLMTAHLPEFGQAEIEARYGLLMGEPVPAEQAEAWNRMRAMADHLLSFDTWLLAVPMWNFGLPYRLKHYIDLVTHPGFTFRNDAAGNVEGLAAGRTAIIVAASAMPFGSVAELDALDFQLAYLKAWLGFVGVSDVHAVRVAGTFGPEEAVNSAMDRARSDALALAARLPA